MPRSIFVLIALTAAGCAGDTATGTLQVVLRGETTITDGLEAGDSREDIVDGWRVRFDAWTATVGHVHLDRTDGEASAQESNDALVVDLVSAPSGGVPVAWFPDIAAGRWDEFEFETPSAREDAEPDDSVSEEDFDAMVDADATFLVEGVIEKDDGQSCPPGGECRDTKEVRFSFAIPAETFYGPCSADNASLAGVVVNEGGITTVAITLHGDHMFFDGFPVSAEIVKRRAQWLADADLDGDDVVTQEELASIDAADLLTSETHAVGGGPKSVPIDTAWDYVRAQMKTVGHFQGEGECPWDGEAHDHEH